MSESGGREVRSTPETGKRAQRSATLLIARCERADGSAIQLRVRNISASGLKGHCPDVVDFDLDEPVKIRFPNLSPIAARVVRYETNEIGVRFERAVDLDRLVKVRAAGKPIEQSPRSETMREWIDHNERLRRGRQRTVRNAG